MTKMSDSERGPHRRRLPIPARRVIAGFAAGVAISSVAVGGGVAYVRSTYPGPGNAITSQIRPVGVPSRVVSMPLTMRRQVAQLTSPMTLPRAAAARVPAAWSGLGAAEQRAFQDLLDRASGGTERAFLYKALAAGRTVGDIARFAAAIGAMSPAEMIARLSPATLVVPLDTVVRAPLRQLSEYTCAATEAQLMRAMADPIYALSLDGPGFSSQHVLQQQLEILAREGSDSAPGQPYPNFGGSFPNWIVGLSDWGQMNEYNALTPQTGVHWVMYSIPANDRRQAWLAIVGELQHQGEPVPLDVGDTQERHATTVLAARGNQILLDDPGYGRIGWITKRQFVEGHMNSFAGGIQGGAGGWPNPIRVVLPDTASSEGLPVDHYFVPGLELWLGILAAGGTVGGLLEVAAQSVRAARRGQTAATGRRTPSSLSA